jgi:flagellar protein FliO/FliZ
MTSSLSSGLDWVGLASSFLLVLGLLALLLFALKRMQGLSAGAGGQRQIQHLETLAAGTRQKIVLLRVKDREILLGVSAAQITALAEWAEPTVTGTTTRAVYAAGAGRSPSLSPSISASEQSTPPLAQEQTTRFAADPRTGSPPSGTLSFAAVLAHARLPAGLAHLFKRKP